MSVYIDRSFLLRLSPKLKRFSQKKPDLYNFRCPICGDSQKSKLKSRGFVYRKKNDYFYICHNCGISTSFYNLLKQVDESLLKEYQLERYKDSAKDNNVPQPSFEEAKVQPVFYQKIQLESIAELPDAHFAKVYVKERRIPTSIWSQLYFAGDFKKFVEDMGIQKDGLIEKDQRLIIPFYNEKKELVAFQGRALGESKMRYITVKLDDDNKKIYGMDRANTQEMICVTEGPIDSMFLHNAIATADSHLQAIGDIIDKSKVTLVYDNEPRNKDIVRTMERAIDAHYNVVIWPEYIEEKDINEMVLSGFSPDEIQDIIDKNTFVNLRAKMEFFNWKKV